MEIGVVLEPKPPIKPIEVKFEGLEPKDSLFYVDGDSLAHTLTDIGYSPAVLRPIIIDRDTEKVQLAEADGPRKAIVINQAGLIRSVRRIYDETLRQMGEKPPKPTEVDNDILSNLLQHKAIQILFPPYWPYLMLKQKEISFFTGNYERRNKYLQMAKEGTLMPNVLLQEQRERAKKYMGRLMELSLKRTTGWIVAHEYEHLHNEKQKLATKIGLASISPLVSLGFVTTVGRYLETINSPMAQDVNITSILLGLGGILLGIAKGRAMEEQASYDAGYENMGKIMNSFIVNHDAFARKILGQTETSSTPAT